VAIVGTGLGGCCGGVAICGGPKTLDTLRPALVPGSGAFGQASGFCLAAPSYFDQSVPGSEDDRPFSAALVAAGGGGSLGGLGGGGG